MSTDSDRPPDAVHEPPDRFPMKVLGATLLIGFAALLSLPCMVPLVDSLVPLDPADGFRQLTEWELPAGAEVIQITNTHGGLTNDGEFTLILQMSPEQVQELYESSSQEWRECPIAPAIVEDSWGMPDHSGTMYYAEKTRESDTDWHRGHVVIVNPDMGRIWIHEWKGPGRSSPDTHDENAATDP